MNLEDDILIERFLRDELSAQEKSNFLERVSADENFKANYVFEKQLFESLNENEWSFLDNIASTEVEEYKEIYQGKEIQELKKTVAEVHKNFNTKKSNKVITLVTGFSAIAALLVISFSVFLNASIDHNQLYADNIALHELISSATRGDHNDNDVISAETLFKEKKYTESLAIFNKVLLTNKEYSTVFIYKAIAHTELHQFSDALLILDKLIASDLIDAEKGYWYKSLVYLKSNNLKKAKNTLQNIVEASYYNKEKAILLLEEL